MMLTRGPKDRPTPLKWARLSTDEDNLPPSVNYKGMTTYQRAGLRFENKFGRRLEKACAELGFKFIPGPWITFEDGNGISCAQPDFLAISQEKVFIFECKLTQKSHGQFTLHTKYMPLAATIWKKPCVPTQVCRRLVDPSQPLLMTLEEVWTRTSYGVLVDIEQGG